MTVNQDHLLWSAKLPNGEVRSGTLEQLSEAFRAGHVGEATLVRSAGSDQWSKLVDVLSAMASGAAAAPPAPVASVPPVPAPAAPPAPAVAVQAAAAPLPLQSVPPTSNGISGDPDAWHVRLPTGQVRSGTREQLEEAFRAGHLQETLLVLAAGARSWVELGTLMRGSGAPPPAVAPSAAPPPVAVAAPAPAAVVAPPPPAVVAPPPSAAPAAPAPPAAPAGDEGWQVRLPDGQIRSGSRQQLEEAFRAGHLDENVPVLAAGATEWLPLRVAASRFPSAVPQEETPAPTGEAPAPPVPAVQAAEAPEAPAESAERPAEHQNGGPAPSSVAEQTERQWQVRLGERQLEAAVQAGLIGDDALVLAPGTEEWVRLGDLRRGPSAASA